MVSFVMKYVDVIAKNFATASAMFLTPFMAYPLFGHEPTFALLLGGIIASLSYAPNQRPAPCPRSCALRRERCRTRAPSARVWIPQRWGESTRTAVGCRSTHLGRKGITKKGTTVAPSFLTRTLYRCVWATLSSRSLLVYYAKRDDLFNLPLPAAAVEFSTCKQSPGSPKAMFHQTLKRTTSR